MHLQTLMLLVLSSDCVNDNWREYFSWVHYFKLDFGFLNFLWLNKFISWTPSSDRLANARLYWEEMVLNYACILILIWIATILMKALRILHWEKLLKIYEKVSISSETLFWIFWWLILPFLTISTFNDIISFKSHPFFSTISSLIIILSIWYCLYKRFAFLKYYFVHKMYPYYSLQYGYLIIFIKTPLIIMFLSKSSMVSTLLMIIILMMQLSILFSLLTHRVEIPPNQHFNKTNLILGNWIITMIMMIISIEKVGKILINIFIVHGQIIKRMRNKQIFYSWSKLRISRSSINDNSVFIIFVSSCLSNYIRI